MYTPTASIFGGNFGPSKRMISERGEFLSLCKSSLDDLESEMIQTMTNLGLSGDIKNHYRTDSEEYRTLTQSTFIKLWKSGLVYLANRPNNYDWASGTTIADAEIIYEDLPTNLVTMKFSIDGESDTILIASTSLSFYARVVL